jgi:DNA-binding LytR/AlgR family response regulator
MKFPVISQESGSLNEIELKDVLYIRFEERCLIYHTGDREYRQLTKLRELEELLYHLGFRMLDKTNLVNIHKIQSIDPVKCKVFFENEPADSSPYAFVAASKYKYLKNSLKAQIEKNLDPENCRNDYPPDSRRRGYFEL